MFSVKCTENKNRNDQVFQGRDDTISKKYVWTINEKENCPI